MVEIDLKLCHLFFGNDFAGLYCTPSTSNMLTFFRSLPLIRLILTHAILIGEFQLREVAKFSGFYFLFFLLSLFNSGLFTCTSSSDGCDWFSCTFSSSVPFRLLAFGTHFFIKAWRTVHLFLLLVLHTVMHI